MLVIRNCGPRSGCEEGVALIYKAGIVTIRFLLLIIITIITSTAIITVTIIIVIIATITTITLI